MDTPEEPLEIAEGVYWVGVIDWNLRDFHGYETTRGGTYNAYLIVDEKITLIDTVKASFADEMIERISRIVDPSEIDYIVANHVEMDHSSALPRILKVAPKARIFATERGKTGLNEYYAESGCSGWNFETVKTGDELKIGKRTLMFIEAVMLHWPDSMQTYLKEDNILFSNDAFGQHIATSKRFDDQVEDVMEDAAIYFANILTPFSSRILKHLETVDKLELQIDMIAPSHGVVWRSDPQRIIDAYAKWASGTSEQKVLVIYDSMWGSTEMMAKAIAEGVRASGTDVVLFHLRKNDWSMLIKELMECRIFALGSPTMHNGMFFTMGGFLTYLKGLRPKGKKVSFFGSYGWGGGAIRQMEEALKNTKMEFVEDPYKVKFRPEKQDLEGCRQLGIKLGEIARS